LSARRCAARCAEASLFPRALTVSTWDGADTAGREAEALCRIYAGTDPKEYEPVTRSLRLRGAATSTRLEARSWAILDEMAETEGTTTPKFLARLHDEVLELRGDVGNFTSLLRVACTVHLERQPLRPRTSRQLDAMIA
jgi:predicted DNA-binding ribbon-helix-helix protein